MSASPTPIRIRSTIGDAGKEHSVVVRHIMRTNNGDTARAAALAGLGIVRQPTFLIGEDLRRKRLVPLLTGYRMPEIDVLAVYPATSAPRCA